MKNIALEEYDVINYQGKEEKRVNIYIENLKEGVKSIEKHGYKNVILCTNDMPRLKKTIDLGFLHDMTYLTSFEIAFSLSKKTNINPIYSLVELRELVTIQGHKIKTSHFPNLRLLHAQNLIDEVESTKELSSLKRLLFYPKTINLKSLENIKSLESIRLLSSKIESFEGIESLEKLKDVEVRNAPKLKTVKHISLSESIEQLFISNTKRLTDYSELAGNSSIIDLSLVTPIDSVAFVPRMAMLKSITGSEIKDGNLQPLLDSKTLESVYFYPQKKHYNYNVSEIDDLLQAK